MSRTCQLIAMGASALVLSTAMTLAQDISAGEEIYQDVCRTCHGPTAKGMASFPKLAGQPAEYLEMRLMQYRSGEKVGPNTPLMAPHAADLSDSDIASIAGYISTSFE